MSEPFIGEIQVFGFNFAPRGWAFCNGALLSIAQNTALFSLLGTTFGGDGQTTFRLPNFANRAVAGQGQGPGLSFRSDGQAFGEFTVTLTPSQMPLHTHSMVLFAQNDVSKRASTPATGAGLSVPSSSAATPFTSPGNANATFSNQMIQGFSGGNQPHENRQPYLAMNFCIALEGIYPSRN